MQVGGIGAGGVGPEISPGAVGGAAPGVSNPAGPQSSAAAGASLSGSVPGSLQDLAGILESYSTSQILFALMMMSAAERDGEGCDSSSSALGFLAGLALAEHVGQALTGDLPMSAQIHPTQGMTGGTINFLA